MSAFSLNLSQKKLAPSFKPFRIPVSAFPCAYFLLLLPALSLHKLSQNQESKTHQIKDNPDLQAAARAYCHLFPVSHIGQRDLELVAAWAWVGVELGGGVVDKVFEFDFIVERHDGLSLGAFGVGGRGG